MKIISYNVNGIRAVLNKGFAEWLEAEQYDIVCLQETKATPEQVETNIFEKLGYHQYWYSAEKKGYSGVLTLSKEPAKEVVMGIGVEQYDREGRVLATNFGDFTILNCYFPSGTSGDDRQSVKMSFLNDFYAWIQDFRKKYPNLIVVGDYNIAHQAIDLHDPVSNKNTTGFLPEERDWLTKWFGSKFIDAFRYLNPDKIAYSWWSFRAGARIRNKGWRIDYQSFSENLKPNLQSAEQLTSVAFSDHCPVLVEFSII